MAVREEILEELHALQAQQAALARRQAELEGKIAALFPQQGLAAPNPTLGGRWKDNPVSDEDLEEARNSWNVHVQEIIRDMEEAR